MIRIGFVGVPGAGKTSTARLLAAQCRSIDGLKNVELCSEYARTYINKYGPITSIFEQYIILKKQISWEDSLSYDNLELLITDSPIFLGFVYCLELKQDNIKDTMGLNNIFKEMNFLNIPNRYDIIFHLPPILKPVNDGIRAEHHFDDNWRNNTDYNIRFVFDMFKPKKFITVDGNTIEDRVKFCVNKLYGLFNGFL